VGAIPYYRFLWIAAIPVGAMANLGMLWLIADVLNGFMAIPNLIALLALSPIVFRLTRAYFTPS
ncbi:MAG: sodium:alanine symporter family protein, partial [Gammaproteobacteria bacterium]